MALYGAVAGAAAGFALDRGTFTPTAGTGTVTTVLGNVVSVVLTMDDVDLTHMFNTVDASGGNANQFTWTADKPTTSANVTPIPATTPWNLVHWIAIGTL